MSPAPQRTRKRNGRTPSRRTQDPDDLRFGLDHLENPLGPPPLHSGWSLREAYDLDDAPSPKRRAPDGERR